MIKIAICDDEADDINKIRLLINEYLTINKIGADIREFHHPEKLLNVTESCHFNLYFLDVVMPMMRGIELGKEIRKYDRTCVIVYVTTEPQFSVQAFSSNPANYLIKPIDKKQLFDTMDLIFSKKEFQEEPVFSFKTKEGFYSYHLFQIEYCEYYNHKINYFIKGEKLEKQTMTIASFQEYVAPLMGSGHFIRVNHSCIVNVACILSLSRTEIQLANSKIIAVSRNYYNVVREAYFSYQVGGVLLG